ncbi:unnamed protein product, partial [Ectocarpus sp. 6 AP-2014]
MCRRSSRVPSVAAVAEALRVASIVSSLEPAESESRSSHRTCRQRRSPPRCGSCVASAFVRSVPLPTASSVAAIGELPQRCLRRRRARGRSRSSAEGGAASPTPCGRSVGAPYGQCEDPRDQSCALQACSRFAGVVRAGVCRRGRV